MISLRLSKNSQAAYTIRLKRIKYVAHCCLQLGFGANH